MKKRPLVCVTWVDAATGDAWERCDDARHQLVMVRSVGWVVKKSKRAMTIVSGVGSNGDGFAYLTIPAGCIRKVEALTRKRSPKLKGHAS